MTSSKLTVFAAVGISSSYTPFCNGSVGRYPIVSGIRRVDRLKHSRSHPPSHQRGALP
jgi:hypothetical protein